MSCRRTLLFATALAAALAACRGPNDVVELTGHVQMPLLLVSQQPRDVSGASYRWDVVEKPAASTAASMPGTISLSFIPDARGLYVIDRWMSYGISDDLTDEFEITVIGIPPVAVIAPPASHYTTIGGTISLDGTASSSAEHLPLAFQWGLATRPFGSTATFADPTAAQTSLVPDVAGGYVITLSVSDGQLSSDPPAMLTMVATDGTIAAPPAPAGGNVMQ